MKTNRFQRELNYFLFVTSCNAYICFAVINNFFK